MDGITDSMDMNLSKLRRQSEGQRSLVCCSPWGRKESEMTEELNDNETYRGFQVALVVKNLPANARDTGKVGLIPHLGEDPTFG